MLTYAGPNQKENMKMRTLRKRLTCVNRGSSTVDQKANETAIAKVRDRYTQKMQAKGWYWVEELAQETSGDCFSRYELYTTMYKPNIKSETDMIWKAKHVNFTAPLTATIIINMVYDLIVQNPIKGVYPLSLDDLTNLVIDVDSDSNTIELLDRSTGITYALTLAAVHKSTP